MHSIKINKQSGFPIYQQIIQSVLLSIKNGTLKPGDKLPTEKELCVEYDIARGTVRKAYDKLQKDRIITITQGKGTFIQQPESSLTSMDIIDKYLDQLLSLSFSLDDIALFISDKLKARGQTQESFSFYIIDNCPEILTSLSLSLEKFPFSKKQLLIHDIIENDFPEIHSADFILTLSRNVNSLEKLLPEYKDRLVPVSAGLSQNTLKALARLDKSSVPAFLCRSRHFSELIKREFSFLDNSFSVGSHILASDAELESFLSGKTHLLLESSTKDVLSPCGRDLLKIFTQRGGILLPLEYTMNQGSLLYIEELIHKLHFSRHKILY